MFRTIRRDIGRLLWALALALTASSPCRAAETVLHSFDANYASGANPVGQLAVLGSTFYGVTELGVNGNGSVFTMTSTGLVKTIHEFAGGASDGSHPNSGLVESGGSFYGTTIYGGPNNAGTIYKITPTGKVALLHAFTGYNSTTPASSDGANPYAGLLLASDGKFYGVTQFGGVYDQGGNVGEGTVFTIKADGTGYQVIHNFNIHVDVFYSPTTGLAETLTGVLYGTSNVPLGVGGIYKLNKDGSGFDQAYVFGLGGTQQTVGIIPCSDLIRATDGNLYGFCCEGGDLGYGTVFKLVPGPSNTDKVTPFWTFDGYTGACNPAWPTGTVVAYPQNRLLVGSDHNLYGVTGEGGAYGYGTAFRLMLSGACTRLTSFSVTDAHGSPNPLVQMGSSFYATSCYGGETSNLSGAAPTGYGSAFAISSSGALKRIYSFYQLDGYQSYSNLVQVGKGSAAAFYGVTYGGGEFGDGTIFKINGTGAFTILHHLNPYLNEGSSPQAGLLLGRDGALYGTTTAGGLYGYGTLFKVTTGGSLTVIHHFRLVEGYQPLAALVQGVGADNNLYGTCSSGGSSISFGSVFSTNTTGSTFQVIHYFSPWTGTTPQCQLVPDGLGNLYGTTYQGNSTGGQNLGTIFKLSTNGQTFTTLFNFNVDNSTGLYAAGANPYYGGPMVLVGGYLYGVAENGGANNDGVIFQCNVATGATISFHDFNNSVGEGTNPVGGLVYSSTNGCFYGVALNGGNNGGQGIIYKVNATTGALTVLHTFTGYSASSPTASDGANPYGGVIPGADGFLYGTTYGGGSANYGTVFKETP